MYISIHVCVYTHPDLCVREAFTCALCTHIQPRNIPLQDCVTREVTRQREGWGESSRAPARGGRAWSRTQPLSSLPACTTLQNSVSLRLCSGLSLPETVFRPGPPRDGARARASPRLCSGLGLPEMVLGPGPPRDGVQVSASPRRCPGRGLPETVHGPRPPRDGARAGASLRRCLGRGL